MFNVGAEEEDNERPVEMVTVRREEESSSRTDVRLYGVEDDHVHAASVEAPRKYYAIARGRSPRRVYQLGGSRTFG